MVYLYRRYCLVVSHGLDDIQKRHSHNVCKIIKCNVPLMLSLAFTTKKKKLLNIKKRLSVIKFFFIIVLNGGENIQK